MTVTAIKYPNTLEDLVVLQYRGDRRMGFLVRPTAPGLYRLFIWPYRLADAELAATVLLDFPTAEGPPLRVGADLKRYDRMFGGRWMWALVRTQASSTALEDFSRAVLGVDVVGREQFLIPGAIGDTATRFVAWSCHQPYEGNEGENARLHDDALDVLEWYAAGVTDFAPHVVWGQGDTAYSDGTGATNLSDQVYGKGHWYSGDAPDLLRQEYRSMYRHFWSLSPMRRVMSRYPHVFIWDDHEIHDGWGSEAEDLDRGNQEMFRIAHSVANEYILNAGPRLRSGGIEAHQGYVLGSMAAFIFDTRSTRNYVADSNRLISRQQFGDFVAFLDAVARKPALTDVITCTR